MKAVMTSLPIGRMDEESLGGRGTGLLRSTVSGTHGAVAGDWARFTGLIGDAPLIGVMAAEAEGER
jgi:hypothetical protein